MLWRPRPRRRMPWLVIEKGPTRSKDRAGKASLLDLFEGRRQLVLYRAFFEPGVFGWPDHACRGLLPGRRPGRPLSPSQRSRHHARLRLTRPAGRHFPPEDGGWNGRCPGTQSPTAFDTDFRRRRVAHGTNVFFRDGDDRIFRTYFINSRGDEAMGSTWNYLDMTPLGRQEKVGGFARRLPPDPRRTSGRTLHDEYASDAAPDAQMGQRGRQRSSDAEGTE